MPVAEGPRSVNRLKVLTPLGAVDQALRLPDDQARAIEGLTAAEWAAFEDALLNR